MTRQFQMIINLVQIIQKLRGKLHDKNHPISNDYKFFFLLFPKLDDKNHLIMVNLVQKLHDKNHPILDKY